MACLPNQDCSRLQCLVMVIRMNVVILHGIGGYAGIHWEQWLHDELKKKSYKIIMPDLPRAEQPSRKEWLKEVKRITENIDSTELVIVAHSLGVTTALDFIEQSSTPLRGLVSVAGFATDYGVELNSYFLKEKSIDLAKVRANLTSAVVFYGDNDPYVSHDALKHLAEELGVDPYVVNSGGHLNTEAGYTEFPAVLEAVVGMKDFGR